MNITNHNISLTIPEHNLEKSKTISVYNNNINPKLMNYRNVEESVHSRNNCLSKFSSLTCSHDNKKDHYLSSSNVLITSYETSFKDFNKTNHSAYYTPENTINKTIPKNVVNTLSSVSLQEPSCSKYSVGHYDYINTRVNTSTPINIEPLSETIYNNVANSSSYTKQSLVSLQEPSYSKYSVSHNDYTNTQINTSNPMNIEPLSETIHNDVANSLSYTKQFLVSLQKPSCSKYSVSHNDYINTQVNTSTPMNIELHSETIHNKVANSLSYPKHSLVSLQEPSCSKHSVSHSDYIKTLAYDNSPGTYNLNATTNYTEFDNRWVSRKDLDELLRLEINSKLISYTFRHDLMMLDQDILQLKYVSKYMDGKKNKKGSRNVDDVIKNIDKIVKSTLSKSISYTPKSNEIDIVPFVSVDINELSVLSDDVDHVHRSLELLLKLQLKNHEVEEEQRNSVDNNCDILKNKYSKKLFGSTSCSLEHQSNSSNDSSDHMREEPNTSIAFLLSTPNKSSINLHESYCAQPSLLSYSLQYASDKENEDNFNITTAITNLPYKNLSLDAPTLNVDCNALNMHSEQMDYVDRSLASVKSHLINDEVVEEQRNSVDNHCDILNDEVVKKQKNSVEKNCDILKYKYSKKSLDNIIYSLGPQSNNGNDSSEHMGEEPNTFIALSASTPINTSIKNSIYIHKSFSPNHLPKPPIQSNSFRYAADKKDVGNSDIANTTITNLPYKKPSLDASTVNVDCNALNIHNTPMPMDYFDQSLTSGKSHTINDKVVEEQRKSVDNHCDILKHSKKSYDNVNSIGTLTNKSNDSSNHSRKENTSLELSFSIYNDDDDISNYNNMSDNDSNNSYQEPSLDNHSFQCTADKQNEESFDIAPKLVTDAPYKQLTLAAPTVDINYSKSLHEENASGEMVEKHHYSLRTCRRQPDHYCSPFSTSYLKKRSTRKRTSNDLFLCRGKGKKKTIIQYRMLSVSKGNSKELIKKICPENNNCKFDGDSQNSTFDMEPILTVKPCRCGIFPSQVPSTWSNSMHENIHQHLNKLKFTVQAGMEIISNVNNNGFIYDIIKINGKSADKQLQSTLKNINEFIDIEMGIRKENRIHSNYSTFLAAIPNTTVIGYLETETLNKAIVYKNNEQLSESLIPVKFGIAKLWVNVKYRNKGVASKLLKQFCNENHLKTNDVAFAHHGSHEIMFIEKFFGNKSVLIY